MIRGMKKTYPSDEQERFLVRLPQGMRDRIAEVAKANNRSMNAEIVARLERSFEDIDGDSKLIDEVLQKILARLSEKGAPPFNHDIGGREK